MGLALPSYCPPTPCAISRILLLLLQLQLQVDEGDNIRTDLLLACAICVLRAKQNGVVDFGLGVIAELFHYDTVLKAIYFLAKATSRVTSVTFCSTKNTRVM